MPPKDAATDPTVGRRPILATLAGSGLGVGFGWVGRSDATNRGGVESGGKRPAVEWNRGYSGENREYAFQAIQPSVNVQTADGGYAIGAEGHEIDTGGSVEWDRVYDDRTVAAFTSTDDGYLFVDETTLLKVDASGKLQWAESLSLDIDVFDFAKTADGGYAFTGDDFTVPDDESQNFVLVKFDNDRTKQWHTEYDGPFEGTDIAYSVVQTGDGGYALSGTMEAAYSGENSAAVVRTDGDGTERWETLVEGQDSFATATSLIQTDDGGFGLTNAGGDDGRNLRAAKLAPTGDDQTATGTHTATPAATSTPSSPITPSQTGTATATETADGTPNTSPMDDGTPPMTGSSTDTRTRPGESGGDRSNPEVGVGTPGPGILGTVGGLASLAGYLLYRNETDNEP